MCESTQTIKALKYQLWNLPLNTKKQINALNLATEMGLENDLEKSLFHHQEFVEGLLWGQPRYGHPEGEVYLHVREVFKNIDQLQLDDFARSRLRIIALIHDSFKYQECKKLPRDWTKHHGVLARQFIEPICQDPVILEITELHDEAFHCWRLLELNEQLKEGKTRLKKLLDRISDSMDLYYLFFKCDTQTGDKTQAPLIWFEKTLRNLGFLEDI